MPQADLHAGGGCVYQEQGGVLGKQVAETGHR